MPCFVYENSYVSNSPEYYGPAEFILIEARNWEDASSYIKKNHIIDISCSRGSYDWAEGRRKCDNKIAALDYVSTKESKPHKIFPVVIYYNEDKIEEYTVAPDGYLALIQKPKKKTKDKRAEARRLMKKYGSNENWGLF